MSRFPHCTSSGPSNLNKPALPRKVYLQFLSIRCVTTTKAMSVPFEATQIVSPGSFFIFIPRTDAVDTRGACSGYRYPEQSRVRNTLALAQPSFYAYQMAMTTGMPHQPGGCRNLHDFIPTADFIWFRPPNFIHASRRPLTPVLAPTAEEIWKFACPKC